MIYPVVLEKNKELFSLSDGFIRINELYQDSFRAYKGGDNCNALYVPNNCIVNNYSFDVIVEVEDMEKSFVLFIKQFLIDYNIDDFFINDDNDDDFYELSENIDELKINNIIIQKYLIKFKKFLSDKLKDEKTDEYYFNIFIDILRFNLLSESISSNDFLNPTVHYGCDCGCGGDMLIDDEYYTKKADKDLKERLKLLEKFKQMSWL